MGEVGAQGGGCCYENSHKDRLKMIKSLVMLPQMQSGGRGRGKVPPPPPLPPPKRKKEITEKGPKQDSQFQPEQSIKMCSK